MNRTPDAPPEIPGRLPLIPLRSTVVYPMGVAGVQLGAPENLDILNTHGEDPVAVVVVAAQGEPDEPVNPKTLSKVGVLGRLSDRLNLPGGTVQTTIQGVRRVRITRVKKNGHFVGRAEPVEEVLPPPEVAEDLIGRILTVLEALSSEVERVSREVPAILRMNVADPGRFADLVASLANFSVREKDEVLQILDVEERLRYILTGLESQVRRIREIEEAGQEEAEPAAGAAAKPGDASTLLRRRIRMLQAELGEIDPVEREATQLLRRVEAAPLPTRVAMEARVEVERLRQIPPAHPEASDVRNYLDWLLHLPWPGVTESGAPEIDLDRLRKVLDEELLGLDEQKERLLDYLAVAKLRGDLMGPIPCLVGPPDVGKRRLVSALAQGLGRPLARVDLAGRGESELVGDRRVKRGARPGKFVQELREVGTSEPVFLLEEIDEVGRGSVEGDPVEALEEALEWESSRAEFVDRYLDVPLDLSGALFIATAQDFQRIHPDLRDFLVEIRLAGYTPEEKVEIARSHLLPRLVREHGLEPGDVDFDEASLSYVARSYTRDAGLGQMRRVLATLLRKRARAKATGDVGKWSFPPDRLEEILGLPRYVPTAAESAPEVGVVTGLAWTAAGGELMFIEALRMPGEGRLIITGLLGDVMRESVNAAYSWVRSRGDDLGIPEETFRSSDVHVHFPVGSIPKDGPSAGIAVTLALASTLSGRPVRHDVAMSGEVTLRGRVLEVGGVKEKVLAAYRAGILEVILPAGNEKDLREVPDDIREPIHFHGVERMEDVLRIALLGEELGARPAIAGAGPQREEDVRSREPRAAKPSEKEAS